MLFLFYLCIIYFINIAPSEAQNVYWREYVPNEIPCDAYEGAPGLYIGQMVVNNGQRGSNAPGTIYPSINMMYAEWNGKQVDNNYFKILCSPQKNKFYWEYVDIDTVTDVELLLKNAVVGGFDVDHYIHIGRIFHDREWKISKVGRGQILHVWVNDNTSGSASTKQFEILKYNMTEGCNEQCHSLNIII